MGPSRGEVHRPGMAADIPTMSAESKHTSDCLGSSGPFTATHTFTILAPTRIGSLPKVLTATLAKLPAATVTQSGARSRTQKCCLATLSTRTCIAAQDTHCTTGLVLHPQR